MQTNGQVISDKMTKSERSELLQIIRKRERVMQTMAKERSMTLLADAEKQLSAIYYWDQDEVWKQANEEAEKAVAEASKVIAARNAALGIPKEFAPGLSLYWHGRGENAVKARRAELRKAAQTRIEAMHAAARTEIERLSLDVQTQVVAHGLESAEARLFLEQMPKLETLMPPLNASELKSLTAKNQ